MGDADELDGGLGVFGLPDADEESFGLGLDVGEVEAGELRSDAGPRRSRSG